MNQQPSHEITLLLDRIRQGDVEATERLLPIVYERLRAMAGALFRGQSPSHTLQPTALVHEAYLKLVDGPGGEKAAWESRAHFMAVASLAMRQILADHARARRARKRGGDLHRVTLDEPSAQGRTSEVDLLDLDDALAELARLNERHARIVEWRFFGGLTTQEIANLLGVSRTTVDNDWRVARAWLSARLGGES